MRADDDVYVRTDRLGRFLRGINSSQPMFIGQAGLGNKAEFGRLSLASQVSSSLRQPQRPRVPTPSHRRLNLCCFVACGGEQSLNTVG